MENALRAQGRIEFDPEIDHEPTKPITLANSWHGGKGAGLLGMAAKTHT